jgi:hypothetical protein
MDRDRISTDPACRIVIERLADAADVARATVDL